VIETRPVIEVDFQPVGKRVHVRQDTSVLQAAIEAGLGITSACGAHGSCGKCRVVILSGETNLPTANEKRIGLQDGERLACHTLLRSDARIFIPPSSLLGQQRLQTDSSLAQSPVDPVVRSFDLEISAPTLTDLRADLQRITDELRSNHNVAVGMVDIPTACHVSRLARHHNWRFRVFVRGDEIVGAAPTGTPPVGMAVDLGTTKIAAYLLDLETGRELAAAGALNPQIAYGEDVISRLNVADRQEDGTRLLAHAVRETLSELLANLTEAAGIDSGQVADCCIVGNTAMTHLLLELPIRQLVRTPYVAAVSSAQDIKVRQIGLQTAPGAYVHILPCIGGFVGADHVAMILAVDMDRVDQVTLGIDIGTNTEILLAHPERGFMGSVSCASGPAFEGAHIANGMRAAPGAIEAVSIVGPHMHVDTVDDAPPIGLCGSGVVDAMAALHKEGAMNRSGRLDADHPWVTTQSGVREVILTAADKSGTGRDITLSQEDINQILLAKGAIRAGLEILLKAAQIEPDAVREIIFAGAFGSFLNINNALTIGLFPRYRNAIFRQVGNAAAVGAKQALLSHAVRLRARQLAAETKYVELSTFPTFNRYFALGMLLPDENESQR
jgi:uncharacterized 2Fe-2S/4Fe-4S cluster protein (DUF4445 family)